MAKNFSATTRSLDQDRLASPLVLLATAVGVALVWLWWFCNPVLPIYQVSRQLYFDGKPGYDTLVQKKDGAYSNRQVKVWTVGAAFSPEERLHIEKGQSAIFRPAGQAVAGAGVIRGVVGETPSWRDKLVRIVILTDIDQTLPSSALGEVRIRTGTQAPVDYVLSGSGIGGIGGRQPGRP